MGLASSVTGCKHVHQNLAMFIGNICFPRCCTSAVPRQFPDHFLGGVHLDDAAKDGGDGSLHLINPWQNILDIGSQKPLVGG